MKKYFKISMLFICMTGHVLMQAARAQEPEPSVRETPQETSKEAQSHVKQVAIEQEAVHQKSEESAEDHNEKAVNAINKSIELHNPEGGGLTLKTIQKSTGTLMQLDGSSMLISSDKSGSKPILQGGSKVDVTVNQQGKIATTTVTHPTSWLGSSKPVTEITHNDDGTHTAVTTDKGWLGKYFSKPETTVIKNNEDKSVDVKAEKRDTITELKHDDSGKLIHKTVTVKNKDNSSLKTIYNVDGELEGVSKYDENGELLFTKSAPDEYGDVQVSYAGDTTHYTYSSDGSVETSKTNKNNENVDSVYNNKGVMQKAVLSSKPGMTGKKYVNVTIERLDHDQGYGVKNNQTNMTHVIGFDKSNPDLADLPQNKLTPPQ